MCVLTTYLNLNFCAQRCQAIVSLYMGNHAIQVSVNGTSVSTKLVVPSVVISNLNRKVYFSRSQYFGLKFTTCGTYDFFCSWTDFEIIFFCWKLVPKGSRDKKFTPAYIVSKYLPAVLAKDVACTLGAFATQVASVFKIRTCQVST